MVGFYGKFLALLALLLGLEMLEPFQRLVAHPWAGWIATASGSLMALLDPDVRVQGRVLYSLARGFGVSIEAGCNGLEAAIVLLAGVVAFPATAQMRILGALAGGLAVQGANILRVISLYYIGLWNADVFEFAHLYVWQALIMLDVFFVWMLWIGVVARQPDLGQGAAGEHAHVG
jgi:exosortase H (IPTLxxWG-CTERM-specific)